MHEPAPTPAAGAARRARGGWLALLVIAVFAAYHNSFDGAFVFDDDGSIAGNETIRRIGTAFVPPADSGRTVAGRPLLNLSFALNRAVGGDAPAGYHAVNLAIHLAAALALATLVARALRGPRLRARWGAAADEFGAAVALLWAVHPLLTESVTYVVQRAESLAGLWVLFALLAFARGAESARPARWWVAAFAATLLGVATKEIAAVVPVLAWLYDGAFVAGGFAEAWRKRWKVYALLAVPWLPLAAFVRHAGNRGGTAGAGTAIDAWSYLLTQTRAVWLYLKLSVWPAPLVLDYGTPLWPLRTVWPFALATAGLFGASLCALARRPAWGFLGAWFFVLLAPSSSVVPVATQTLAEHRMYLPLAAVVAAALAPLWSRFGRRAGWWVAALAVVAIVATARRNDDYRNAEFLWRDSATKAPENPRAWGGLGTVLFDGGRAGEAIEALRRAVALAPQDARYRLTLARALAAAGRREEAWGEFDTTLRLAPGLYEAHVSYGNALVQAGRPGDAVPFFTTGAALRPASGEARFNLANALWWSGRPADALPHYERTLALEPAAVDVRTNYAGALVAAGRATEAIAEAERVLARDAAVAQAHVVVGQARLALGDPARAAEAFRAALQLKAESPDALFALGQIELAAERPAEAEGCFSALLKLAPDAAPVHNARGIALAQLGRMREARDAFAKAAALAPGFTEAQENLQRAERQLRE